MWENLGIHKYKINLMNTWGDMGTVGICAKAHGNTWMINYECFRNTNRKKITGNIGGAGGGTNSTSIAPILQRRKPQPLLRTDTLACSLL